MTGRSIKQAPDDHSGSRSATEAEDSELAVHVPARRQVGRHPECLWLGKVCACAAIYVYT